MLKGRGFYRKGAKVAKGRGGRRVRGYLLMVIGKRKRRESY
jgi:hypothetical protein